MSLASLQARTNQINPVTAAVGSGSGSSTEREHVFEKVVTPSDVGKLNWLVIPKRHVEKYFPEKGVLLSFENRNGKLWRFRYWYSNSSQCYVMTGGCKRFVKEKNLQADFVVSFQRGVGETGKHQLYIDCRQRANEPNPTTPSQLDFPNRLALQRPHSLHNVRQV